MTKDFQFLFCIVLCNLDVYNKMQLYHFKIYLQKMLKEINQVNATKKKNLHIINIWTRNLGS